MTDEEAASVSAGESADPFDFTGRTVVLTGALGVLCREIAVELVRRGASVALLARSLRSAEEVMARMTPEGRRRAVVLEADVLDPRGLDRAVTEVLARFGRIDALVNGAGGNTPEATTSPGRPFFDLPPEALRQVLDLNLMGTILPSQAFGRGMARQGEGVILNVSSMNASRPLTRIPAYSAAKAGVSNFTAWLAVHMAVEYSPRIRVNAIAPGFFLTRQNEFLLVDNETKALTARGQAIVAHTPMGRFGRPEELVGTALWLLSSASSFVTGVVVPVDGGFNAFSGV